MLMIVSAWVLWLTFAGFLTGSGAQRTLILDGIGTCDAVWTPAYSSSRPELTLAGLQQRVLGGHMVKVMIEGLNSISVFELDDITFRGSHVCGSQTWYVSHNFTHIDTNPDNTPIVVCTTGMVSQIQFPTTNWIRDVKNMDIATEMGGALHEITWYTKPIACGNKGVYSNFVDGSPAGGSHTRLLEFAKWSQLRIGMRDRGFFTTVQNVKIYKNDLQESILLSAQTLNHFGLKYTAEAVKFNTQPTYKWFASWSTDGRRDVSRWFVANTTEFQHRPDFVALDWFGDECWRRVYSTDADQMEVQGSLQELITMVKLGHRLRVHFDGITLKANGIRVIGNLLVAQSIEEMGRKGDYPRDFEAPFFTTRPQYVFRLIHSHGMVKTYRFNMDDFSPVGRMVSTKPAIVWMVDTRTWTKVYATDSGGTAHFGDAIDLEQAVHSAATVRLNIEQDETSGMFFTEADSVHFNMDTFVVHAQSLKHVSDEKQQGKAEYNIQKVIFQWAIMADSDGLVTMNARYLASRDQFYEAEAPNTNVTWFVNL